MKKNWGLLLVLILSLWAIKPLLQSGFFPIHDNTQVIRVQQMAEALKAGQFPVRWVGGLGYGYGYPIFNFYAPLAYYFGALYSLLGFGPLLATKLMIIDAILLAAVFMYLLGREVWGEVGGTLTGLFYLYAPYHALDIYVRGAVGELWAMAFLPLVFYGFLRLAKEKKKSGMIMTSLGFAAVILSHNLTAMMVIPFIFLSALFAKDKKQGMAAIVIALALSCFYWLPALVEMNLTQVFSQIGGGANWQDHFVFLDQLWASPWGFGGSAPGRLDGMSFMIGKVHLLFVLFSLITLVFFWRKEKGKRAIFLISFFVFSLAIFLTNQVSWPVWHFLSPLAFIQYPWRFLLLASLAASFLAGSVSLWFKKKPEITWVGGIVITLVLIIFNLKYFQPQSLFKVSKADYLNEERIKWTTSKISDEYLPKDFPEPETKDEVAWEKIVIAEGEGKVKNLVIKPDLYSFDLEAKTEAKVLVNLAYFPGWEVKGADFRVEEGRVEMSLSPGEHEISFSFKDTPVRRIANFVSLASLLGLILILIRGGNRKALFFGKKS